MFRSSRSTFALVLLALWAQEAAAFLPGACFTPTRPIVRAVPKSMHRVAAQSVASRAGPLVMQLLPRDETGEEKPAVKVSAKQGTDAVGAEKENVNYVPMASWFLVAVLLMTNIHQQWTRALVFYIVSFKVPVSEESARLYMNIDLGFGEEQYALLASFGFTALFTVCRHVCHTCIAEMMSATCVDCIECVIWVSNKQPAGGTRGGLGESSGHHSGGSSRMVCGHSGAGAGRKLRKCLGCTCSDRLDAGFHQPCRVWPHCLHFSRGLHLPGDVCMCGVMAVSGRLLIAAISHAAISLDATGDSAIALPTAP